MSMTNESDGTIEYLTARLHAAEAVIKAAEPLLVAGSEGTDQVAYRQALFEWDQLAKAEPEK